MTQRRVDFLVVERPVQIKDVVGKPAENKAGHENEHDLSQAFPGLHLGTEAEMPIGQMEREAATAQTHHPEARNLISAFGETQTHTLFLSLIK